LQGQQLYYKSLKQHRDEIRRYERSKEEHESAVQLLQDLSAKVRALVNRGVWEYVKIDGKAQTCRKKNIPKMPYRVD